MSSVLRSGDSFSRGSLAVSRAALWGTDRGSLMEECGMGTIEVSSPFSHMEGRGGRVGTNVRAGPIWVHMKARHEKSRPLTT